MNCHPEDRKLFLSLKIDSTKLFGDKDMSQNKFEVGKIVDVRVKKKTEKGLDVVLKGKKFQAFLPLLHLSDHVENCQSLLECYNEKDVITVLCFSSKGVPIVTVKSSLIEAARNGVLHPQMSEYEEQTIIPVVVKHFAKFGMFVELGYNITGLVPNKYIADRKITQPEEAGFVPYQTLMGKIHKIEPERSRVELSTKMEDVYKNEYTFGLDLLQSYFDDTSKIRQYCLSIDDVKSKLAQLSVGSIVLAKVTSITEIGVLCELPGGLKGFATIYHCGTTRVEEGQNLQAVVLYVDMISECVELSFRPNFVRNVSNLQDIDSSKVKIDQVIKSECVLIKKEFVVVALGGHAVGRFAFVPARQALNDLIGRGDLFTVGQHYHVVIKRIYAGDIAFGVLKQHVKDLSNDVTVLKRKKVEEDVQARKRKHSGESTGDSVNESSGKRQHRNKDDDEVQSVFDVSELVVGKKYVATIKKIKEFQMDILINDRIPGRVHITEVVKDLTTGIKPFKTFTPGDEVKVWLIGFHSKKSHNYLGLSHCRMKTYAECSLFKHSALNRTFGLGDEVKGVVKEVNNTDVVVWLAPDVKGILPIHHINGDFRILVKPSKHIHSGDVVEAQVFNISDEKIQLTQYHDWKPEPGMNIYGFVYLVSADEGMSVKLPHGYSGKVQLTDLRDSYIPADNILLPLLHRRVVQCHILDVNEHNKFCQLSTRVSRLQGSRSEPKDPELSQKNMKSGITARGFVTSVTNTAVTVALGRNLKGTVSISGMESDERNAIVHTYSIGSVVEVKVLSSKDGEMALSIICKEAEKTDTNSDSCAQKVKKNVNEDLTLQSESPTKSVPCLQVPDSFSVRGISDLKRPAEDLSDMSDSDEAPSKKRKKNLHKLDEKFVFETENSLMNEDRTAQTSEDYEEVLKQAPNSAGHWLNYIGFYLEQTEVDKARSVAERALKTISFREEQEKLKIWIVYLNLENLYGTQETMQNVFERAVQLNEPLKVYNVVVRIYLNSNKTTEAESLYKVMVKKFRLNKDVWIDFGLFYMKSGRPKLAREVMDRSLKSLEQRQHVDVIAKFSQMEIKHGDINLGKTMFENVLKNYPKRTDLYSIYIDLLIRLHEFDAVRKLFKEVTAMKLSVRKMKFFFKRYLTFEREHGTDEMANEIERKASEYFKSDFF